MKAALFCSVASYAGPYIGLSKGGFVFFKSPENSRAGVVGEVLSIPGGGSRFDVFKRGVRSQKGGSNSRGK